MADEELNNSAPKRDLGKILTFVYIALNTLAMVAGTLMVYVSTIGHESKAATSQELEKEYDELRAKLETGPVLYSMEPFNTNLNGVPRRLIRVEVNLEMLDAEGFEEVITMGAQARDTIMKILGQKTFNDVESVQGKLHLKNDIIAGLNSMLSRGVVRNVYFSDFVVQ